MRFGPTMALLIGFGTKVSPPVHGRVLARELLTGLPERKVTFATVLNYALRSNSFKAVIAAYATSSAIELPAEASLDFQWVAKLQTSRELNKPQSLLLPVEVAVQATSLGLEIQSETEPRLIGWQTVRQSSNLESMIDKFL